MAKRPGFSVSSDKGSSKSTIADFPVVGIGASAGGLDAFTALLNALPADTGMAFVLVSHMDPTHESLLYQLLAKATSMRVLRGCRSNAPGAQSVYVIPPNKYLTIDSGSAPAGEFAQAHMPIDRLLLLACKGPPRPGDRCHPVWNGIGWNAGLKAIKGFGGITFAQDEKSAKFYRHADERCRFGLCRLCFASGKNRSPAPTAGTASWFGGRFCSRVSGRQRSKALKTIFVLLRAATDVDFSLYKLPTIKRRIDRRMALRAFLIWIGMRGSSGPSLPRFTSFLKTF